MDFGYVNPCAFIKLHLDTHQHKIWVLEEYYIKQVTTDVFAQAIKDKAEGHVVFCDFAEPDRITTLKKFGIAADKCKKGKAKGTKQAVTRRIDWLHDYEIIVDIGGFKWMIQTTDFVDVDEHIGLKIDPDAIHIMDKSEYSGMFGDYSSFSEEYDELSQAESGAEA